MLTYLFHLHLGFVFGGFFIIAFFSFSYYEVFKYFHLGYKQLADNYPFVIEYIIFLYY